MYENIFTLENKNATKYELQSIYNSQKSFYRKAFVYIANNIKYLVSYSTIVAKIGNGKLFINGYYSPTTARHINEFLQQNGYSRMTKKEMLAY